MVEFSNAIKKFLKLSNIELYSNKPFDVFVVQENEKVFNYSWFTAKPEYVKVYLNGNELKYSIDYNVDVNEPNTGGTVTLINQPNIGSILVIRRESDIERVSQYTQGGEFRAKTVNGDFNYITSILQEIAFALTRVVSISKYDYVTTQDNLTLPDVNELKGKLIGVDLHGKIIGVDIPKNGGGGEYVEANWVKTNKSFEMIDERKLYVLGENEDPITITLPNIISALDNGREVIVMNVSDVPASGVIVKVYNDATTIGVQGGVKEVVLRGGIHLRLVYDVANDYWLSVDPFF